MLKDVLTKNLDVVFCGTAKGKASGTKGYYYAGSGNKFYNTLYIAGFTPIKLDPKDCYDIDSYNIGLTDLVHNEFGNDKEISDENYDVEGFVAKMMEYQPRYIAFNGKRGASFVLGYKGKTKMLNYGLQSQTVGKSKLFVLPSTSGNAKKHWDESYWHELKVMIDQENKINKRQQQSGLHYHRSLNDLLTPQYDKSKIMEWKAIKETIIKFLSENTDRELKTPDRRLRELEKIESQLSKKYIKNPKELLSVDKQQLPTSLGIKNGAAMSIVNNIYDVLNGNPLKAKKINND